MKTIASILLAGGILTAIAAPTANEDFVIAEDAKTYTNAVNAAKDYTDAAIRALPSGGISTNDVCAIVTNEVAVFTRWTWDDGGNWDQPFYTNGVWHCAQMDNEPEGSPDDTRLTFYRFNSDTGYDVIYVATRELFNRNALGIAYDKDLPQKTPVDEILFNGADGKVYHLRIGAGGSVDIYTEVAQ